MRCTHIGRTDIYPAAVDILLRQIPSHIAGELLRGLAATPGCIESFYESIRWSLETRSIHNAAVKIRKTAHLFPASASACSFFYSDYNREDIRELKYAVEVFHYVEPVFAILSALTERWLNGDYGPELPLYEPDSCISFMPIGFDDIELPEQALSSIYEAFALCSSKMDLADRMWLVIDKARELSNDILLLPAAFPKNVSQPAISELVNSSLGKSAEMTVITSIIRNIFIADEVAGRKSRDQCNKLGRTL